MTCERYADTEMAEHYLAGTLPPDEEVAFEQHYLGCESCLDTIRGLEDVRDALAAARTAPLAAHDLARREATSETPRSNVAPFRPRADRVSGATGTNGTNGTTATTGVPSVDARASAAQSTIAPSTTITPTTTIAPSTSAGRPRWMWAAAAAIAASAILGFLWLRALAPSPQDPLVARHGSTPQQPSPRPNPPAPPRPAPPSRSELIAPLAIVVPPPYVAVPVRSEAEETSRAFASAMEHYRARDYRAAADGLRALVETAPRMISAQFFLGISELMNRQPDRAEAALRHAAGSGVTPFADEAHFYLAKAALQREDLATAERELARTVSLDAGPDNEARTLLEQVRALRGGKQQ